MNVSRFVLMLALAGAGWSAFATTCYVSLLGSDETGTGTQAKPYRTIQKALDNTSGWNSWVWISNGVYKLDSELVPKSNGFYFRSTTGNPADVVIDGQGQCRCLNASTVYSAWVSGITFVNGKATGSGAAGKGGAIRFGDISTIDNCVFSNCVSQTDGGAVFAPGTSGIKNVLVANCTASGCGGGISLYTKSSGPFTGMTFTNCVAGSKGGGLYIDSNGGPAFHNATFTDCRAAEEGGGVYAYGRNIAGGTLLTNVVIRNCSVTGGGTVAGGGGSLYYYNCSDFLVTDCRVVQTTKTAGIYRKSEGGGLRLYNSTLSNSVVRSCGILSEQPNQYYAWERGGGIYNTYSSSQICNMEPFIVDCVVRDCYVTNGVCSTSLGQAGGGIAVEGAGTRIERCDISGNRTMYTGGGVGVIAAGVTIRNCTVTNNLCMGQNTDANGAGSGIYGYSGSLTVDSCLVQSNIFAVNCSTYNYGGSAVWLAGSSKLLNSVVAGNRGGKSVCAQWTACGNILISNCLFKANRALATGNSNRGGMFGIYNQKGTTLVTDCRFVDCESKGDCGGFLMVALDTTTTGRFCVRNCLITGLTCPGSLYWANSGATQNGRVKVSFENCTLVGNKPTRAVFQPYYENDSYYWGRDQTSVTGCAIFYNNGYGAFDGAYAYHSNVTYNCAGTVGTQGGNVVYDSKKPLFAGWQNGNVRPARDSQLLDVVPAQDWMAAARDMGIDYEITYLQPYGATVRWKGTRPRLTGAKADIGCCEYRPPQGAAVFVR